MVLYVGKANDPIVMMALNELEKLGATVKAYEPGTERRLLEVPTVHAMEMVALFSSQGDFPNRYFRFVKDEDRNRNRNIIVPEWASLCGTKIAINGNRLPALQRHAKFEPDFRSGVMTIHAKLTGFERPKRRRSHSGGYQRSRKAPYLPL